MNIQAERAGMTAFPGIPSLQPARLLSVVDYEAVGEWPEPRQGLLARSELGDLITR
jgi:hypothetical protein